MAKAEVTKINELIKKSDDNGQRIERRADGSIRVCTVNTEPSKTQKHLRDMVNVNSIMRKHSMDSLPDIPSVVADFSNLGDYHEMMNAVKKAQASFNQLPSVIRNRFSENPQELIDFVSDNKNYDEAAKLGLVKPKHVPSTGPATPQVPKT